MNFVSSVFKKYIGKGDTSQKENETIKDSAESKLYDSREAGKVQLFPPERVLDKYSDEEEAFQDAVSNQTRNESPYNVEIVHNDPPENPNLTQEIPASLNGSMVDSLELRRPHDELIDSIEIVTPNKDYFSDSATAKDQEVDEYLSMDYNLSDSLENLSHSIGSPIQTKTEDREDTSELQNTSLLGIEGTMPQGALEVLIRSVNEALVIEEPFLEQKYPEESSMIQEIQELKTNGHQGQEINECEDKENEECQTIPTEFQLSLDKQRLLENDFNDEDSLCQPKTLDENGRNEMETSIKLSMILGPTHSENNSAEACSIKNDQADRIDNNDPLEEPKSKEEEFGIEGQIKTSTPKEPPIENIINNDKTLEAECLEVLPTNQEQGLENCYEALQEVDDKTNKIKKGKEKETLLLQTEEELQTQEQLLTRKDVEMTNESPILTEKNEKELAVNLTHITQEAPKNKNTSENETLKEKTTDEPKEHLKEECEQTSLNRKLSIEEFNLTETVLENPVEETINENSIVPKEENKRIYKRQDTQEFEKLERQFEETEHKVKFKSEDILEELIPEDSSNSQENRKVYYRQDTQEFEKLERQYKEAETAIKFDDILEELIARSNETEDLKTDGHEIRTNIEIGPSSSKVEEPSHQVLKNKTGLEFCMVLDNKDRNIIELDENDLQSTETFNIMCKPRHDEHEKENLTERKRKYESKANSNVSPNQREVKLTKLPLSPNNQDEVKGKERTKTDVLQLQATKLNKPNNECDSTRANEAEQYRNLLKEYEKQLSKQAQELEQLKMESEKQVRLFTTTEMAFSDVFEKYEKAKYVITTYRNNEDILLENLQNAEDHLSRVEAKTLALKRESMEQINQAQERVEFEKRKYHQEIKRLNAQVKVMEIKATSLEIALQQKTDECRALTSLCEDITGRSSSKF